MTAAALLSAFGASACVGPKQDSGVMPAALRNNVYGHTSVEQGRLMGAAQVMEAQLGTGAGPRSCARRQRAHH